ncbi:hypothetical protein HMI01_18750 [Halolactibacillus miurensis]|uniref:DUF4340 domain-containing protein n=1 Tax=Halolactibacillus miurensis TaxID=306541 RepID=A0A1I6U0S4_9BACI|nr:MULTISPECIES: DUF4340 domain-containing protein [Halolactibacillus]GEM04887.1 hypothetical protein HMI01_18750 [Halolactibacillus miurensis]SFS95022.1 protein of unknown function [Halolactibacillus miurensis]
MKKKGLILIVVIIIAIAILFFIQLTKEKDLAIQDQPAEKTPEETESYSFIKEPTTITAINFLTEQGFVLEKTEGSWTVAGRAEETDQAIVTESLQRLSLWEGERANVNRKDVGLDFPLITLKIKQDEKEKKLAIGELNMAQTAYYVSDDQTGDIYLVNRDLVEQFPFYAEAFLDRSLLSELSTIDTVTIDNETEVIELTRENPFTEAESLANITGWFLKQPFNYPQFTSYSVTETFVQTLSSLSFEELVMVDKADEITGLTESAFTIAFTSADSEKVMIIGKPASQNTYYATFKNDDQVFTLANEVVRVFSTPSEAFHDGFIKVIALDTLDELMITTKDSVHALHVETEGKGDDKTTVFTANDAALDASMVRKQYTALAGLQGTERSNVEVMPTRDISLTYKINTEDGIKEVVVVFSEYDATHYAAFVDGVNDFIIEKSQVNEVVNAMVSVIHSNE